MSIDSLELHAKVDEYFATLEQREERRTYVPSAGN
jgi:hypothetical protein